MFPIKLVNSTDITEKFQFCDPFSSVWKLLHVLTKLCKQPLLCDLQNWAWWNVDKGLYISYDAISLFFISQLI